MTEQQYTCPFCHKDYVKVTIHEHYGCGVEPFENEESIKGKPESISNEASEQEAVETYGSPTETEPTIETTQPPQPEPKKRGRKPKSVA